MGIMSAAEVEELGRLTNFYNQGNLIRSGNQNVPKEQVVFGKIKQKERFNGEKKVVRALFSEDGSLIENENG
ncbi:Hypothetical protein FKW44_004131, partial [Caligus rogercresseyi]